VKVFNTGKLEIPGILNESLFDRVKVFILEVMTPMFTEHVSFRDVPNENVLINSNFTCNFNINRDTLHSILRGKYDIDATYDSCNYPGVKCKYYFYNDFGMDAERQRGTVMEEDRNLTVEELTKTLKYTKVSFMIFRTGGCLIVGNCSEEVLRFVYEFVKKMLLTEFPNIFISRAEVVEGPVVDKKDSKMRKRKIMVSTQYFSALKSIEC
jgi:TATA-box binding protein (TBP) (component of TFIID and TFIIIB)